MIFDADWQLSWPQAGGRHSKPACIPVTKPVKCPSPRRREADLASSVSSEDTVIRIASAVLSDGSEASSPKSSREVLGQAPSAFPPSNTASTTERLCVFSAKASDSERLSSERISLVCFQQYMRRALRHRHLACCQ